jgi:hypothetical protein
MPRRVSFIILVLLLRRSGFWSDDKSHGVSLSLNLNLSQKLILGLSYAFEPSEFIEKASIGKEETNNYRVNSEYSFSEGLGINSYLKYEISWALSWA